MKHLKTYNQINELHSDTYKDAWYKVSRSGDLDKVNSFVDSYYKKFKLHPAITNPHTEMQYEIVRKLTEELMRQDGGFLSSVYIDGYDDGLDEYTVNDGEYSFYIGTMNDVEYSLNKMVYGSYMMEHGYEEGDVDVDDEYVSRVVSNIMDDPSEIAIKLGPYHGEFYIFEISGVCHMAIV